MQVLNAVQKCVNNSIEKNRTCGANSLPASQETDCTIWSVKAHIVLKEPATCLILSQKNSIRTTPLDFSKISSSLRLRLPSYLTSSGFPTKFCMHFSSVLACYMSCPSRPPSFINMSNIWSGIKNHATLKFAIFSPSSCRFCSFTPNVSSAPYSRIPSYCSLTSCSNDRASLISK